MSLSESCILKRREYYEEKIFTEDKVLKQTKSLAG